MTDSDKIAGSTVANFLKEWYRHPLSISIVTIVTTFAFVFMTLHGGITPDGIKLSCYAFIFSLLIFSIIAYILYNKKNVLYNSLDQVMIELNHRVHLLQESLSQIEIGIGTPYDEYLEILCPKTAKNKICDHIRADVQIFEFLIHMLKDCGIDEIKDDILNLALSKFYYKEQKYEQALMKIEKVKGDVSTSKKTIYKYLRHIKNSFNKSEYVLYAPEVNFCKGLILLKLGREDEGMQQFLIAADGGHKNASYWHCTSIVDLRSITRELLQEFITKAKQCKCNPTENCINRLATAYYKMATIFLKDEEERQSYFKEAIANLNKAIGMFDSWVAYFNKACDLSIMASYKITEEGELYNDDVEERMKLQINDNLKKAFEKKPSLVVHANDENDLVWFRNKYPDQYNLLIGRILQGNPDLL